MVHITNIPQYCHHLPHSFQSASPQSLLYSFCTASPNHISHQSPTLSSITSSLPAIFFEISLIIFLILRFCHFYCKFPNRIDSIFQQFRHSAIIPSSFPVQASFSTSPPLSSPTETHFINLPTFQPLSCLNHNFDLYFSFVLSRIYKYFIIPFKSSQNSTHFQNKTSLQYQFGTYLRNAFQRQNISLTAMFNHHYSQFSNFKDNMSIFFFYANNQRNHLYSSQQHTSSSSSSLQSLSNEQYASYHDKQHQQNWTSVFQFKTPNLVSFYPSWAMSEVFSSMALQLPPQFNQLIDNLSFASSQYRISPTSGGLRGLGLGGSPLGQKNDTHINENDDNLNWTNKSLPNILSDASSSQPVSISTSRQERQNRKNNRRRQIMLGSLWLARSIITILLLSTLICLSSPGRIMISYFNNIVFASGAIIHDTAAYYLSFLSFFTTPQMLCLFIFFVMIFNATVSKCISFGVSHCIQGLINIFF